MKCLFKFFFVLLAVMSINVSIFASAGDGYADKRKEMVRRQIRERGINDEKVLQAMEDVPREAFVPNNLKDMAYDDTPLPIGRGQTISQPYIVAYMTQAAHLTEEDRVLEVGTGSGYQAAILAEIVKEVYTIEINEELSESARERLEELGYKNIFIKYGDGYQGWKEYAPFDAIIITAAPDEIPQGLINQMKIGGRMVVPVGSFYQVLYLITRREKGYDQESLVPVRFVPMLRSKNRLL